MKFAAIAASAALIGASLLSIAQAAPIQTIGAGSAVTTADRSAGFDTLRDWDSTAYQEDGLAFSAASGYIVCQQGGCGGHPGFANMSGGIYYNVGAYAQIQGVDNAVFHGFETTVGTGYYKDSSSLHGVWKTFLGGLMTGTGTFDVLSGSVIGLADSAGFDMVQIGTDYADSTKTDFLGGGATGIDNVAFQVAAAQDVPEPMSLALAGLGLAAMGAARRRKQLPA